MLSALLLCWWLIEPRKQVYIKVRLSFPGLLLESEKNNDWVCFTFTTIWIFKKCSLTEKNWERRMQIKSGQQNFFGTDLGNKPDGKKRNNVKVFVFAIIHNRAATSSILYTFIDHRCCWRRRHKEALFLILCLFRFVIWIFPSYLML